MRTLGALGRGSRPVSLGLGARPLPFVGIVPAVGSVVVVVGGIVVVVVVGAGVVVVVVAGIVVLVVVVEAGTVVVVEAGRMVVVVTGAVVVVVVGGLVFGVVLRVAGVAPAVGGVDPPKLDEGDEILDVAGVVAL
jgi:hypothetical protein